MVNRTLELRGRGARGRMGDPSGPLGAGSVTAPTIVDTTAGQNAIAAKLRVPQLTANGGRLNDGGTIAGEGWFRDDAAYGWRAPAAGTPGQRHVGVLFEQQHTDDEWYILGAMTIGGVKTQTHTYFHALEGHDANPVSYRPYMASHGLSWRGDYCPRIEYMDNSIEFLPGQTGGGGMPPFDRGLTAPDWMRNFQHTILQGGLKVGNTTQSYDCGGIAEFVGPTGGNGFIFVGTQAAAGEAGTRGFSAGHHAASNQTLFQSFDFGVSTFQPMTINASETRFGTGHVVAVADNTIDLGKSGQSWRNAFFNNAPTIASDGRLKKVRKGPSAKEKVWAKAIKFVPYQLLDAIKEKGEENARIHWGVIAQDVAQAGINAGIENPYRYSFLTIDPLFETETFDAVEPQNVMVAIKRPFSKIEIIDGQPVLKTGETEHLVQKTKRKVVKDEAGKVVMIDDPRGPYKMIDPKTGLRKERPKIKARHDVPVVEMVPVKHTRQVPVLVPEGGDTSQAIKLDDGTYQDVRHGVRYETLFAFLLACGVFGTGE